MSKLPRVGWALLPSAFLMAAFAVAQGPGEGTQAASGSSEGAARIDRYAKENGDEYFVLRLTPPAQERTGPHNHVILFDTSASQTGDFRVKALSVLESYLASVPEGDRVRLFAVDLNAVPMCSEFVAPTSPEMDEALKKLKGRVPLGATDLARALETATEGLDGADTRSIVYMGDGQSPARRIPVDRLNSLVTMLVERRVAVNSYVIGPSSNGLLPAVLANHTGGLVTADADAITPESAGMALVSAARQPIVWASSVRLPEGVTHSFPTRVPPLRSDRDSILVGMGKLPAYVDVAVSGEWQSGPVELSWTAVTKDSNEDYSFLVELVERSKMDDGMTLPTAGSVALDATRKILATGAFNLNVLGRQAMAAGRLEEAAHLADGALRVDPSDPDALALRNAVLRSNDKSEEDELRLTSFQDPAGSGDGAGQPASGAGGEGADAGALLETVMQSNRAVTQAIQTDVRSGINQARKIMGTDPAAATLALKELQERMMKVPELDEEVRGQLLTQIESAMRESARREVEKTATDVQREAVAQEAEERRRVAESLYAREAETEQAIARFNALVDEGRYRDAELVANLAEELSPNRPATSLAVENIRMVYSTHDALLLREKRWVGVVDSLAAVERSHVPTSDDPPILYPPAEVWIRLTERRRQYASVDLAASSDDEKAILDALNEETSLAFADTPLTEVAAFIEATHKIPVEIDTKAFDNAGVATDSPVTVDLSGISLRSALKRMLKNLELTYIIEDEVLLITTPEEAEAKMVTKVYPVGDLVIPPGAGQGAFGGLGGGGGFGGGLGGGGFGGGGLGGGGFGGGGLGGGGGGFFNIPPGLLNGGQVGGFGGMGGFRAFRVEDDLRLDSGKEKEAAPQAPSEPQPVSRKETVVARPARQPMPIELAIPQGISMETAWNDFFASNQPADAEVRATVRHFVAKKDFAQVVAVIQAALRNRQPQEWMYEGLAIALEQTDASPEDVERALMSSADFADNPLDAMYLAQQLGNRGFHDRALDMFRQVSEAFPLRPEPYMHGLDLSMRSNNLDGIQWSTVGILRQAWAKDQISVWDKACLAAKSTLDGLKKDGREQEAKDFEAALNRALVRDCVVRVSWTGDADVDLLVEEPTGTVCSFRSPRTASGGVMSTDSFARLDTKPTDVMAECYVCPEAFDGTYRMRLRKVWGKIATGQVTVEIIKHFGTEKAEVLKQQIPMNDDDSVVIFDLVDGRRTEPIKDEQIATAAASQLAVRREIVAQQAGGSDSMSGNADFFIDRGRFFNPAFRRAFGNGAVGFQPVIITLPEGAFMSATAVISADRRYVRFTGTPVFSGIAEVNTFNFATGASGTSGGGTGGQGFGGGGFGGGGQGGFGGGGLGGGGLGGGGLGGGGFGGGGGGFGGGF